MRVGDAVRRADGEDDQSGEKRDERVDRDDPDGLLHERMFLADVAAANRHGSRAQRKREEGLPHRLERRPQGVFHELGPVRLQVEGQPLRGARQGDGAHDQYAQKDEKRNHHPLRRALHALHDPHKADKRGNGDRADRQRGAKRTVRRQRLERAAEVRRRSGVEDEIARVLHEPAGDVRIVDHQDEGARRDKDAQDAPEALPPRRRQNGQGGGEAPVRAAPDAQLGHQKRQPQQEEEGEIDDDERRAPVVADYVGKSPHVPQPHGAPRRQHQETQTVAQAFAHDSSSPLCVRTRTSGRCPSRR